MNFSKSSTRNTVFLIGSFIIGVIVLVALSVGSYYINNREQSTDSRSQAFVNNGGVAKIELSKPQEVSQVVGQSQKVALRFSTQSAPISGIQVVVEMKHGSLSDVVFTPSVVTGLELISNQTEAIGGGKRFLLAFGSNPLTTPFNSGIAYQTLGHFEYVQPQGTVTFEFQSETMTIAPETGNDTLSNPANRLVAYGLTTASPTPTPTPTPSSGVGGITVLACNAQCTSHAQCAANSFCSNGRCRNTACSQSENCVCVTPTPRASSIGARTTPTPTPRTTPRATPRATTSPNGQVVFDEDSKGFDSNGGLDPTISGQITDRMTPTAMPSASPDISTDTNEASTFTPRLMAVLAVSVIGFFIVIAMFLSTLMRRRKQHDTQAMHSLGMMVHSTQPAQQKMSEVVEQPVTPVVEEQPVQSVVQTTEPPQPPTVA